PLPVRSVCHSNSCAVVSQASQKLPARTGDTYLPVAPNAVVACTTRSGGTTLIQTRPDGSCTGFPSASVNTVRPDPSGWLQVPSTCRPAADAVSLPSPVGA